MAIRLLRCLTAWSLVRSPRKARFRSVALLAAAGVLASTPLPLSLLDLRRVLAVDVAACVESCTGSCPMHLAAQTTRPDRAVDAAHRPPAPARVRCVLAPGPRSLPGRGRIFRMAWSLPAQRIQFADTGYGSPGPRGSDQPADRTTIPARRPPRFAMS
jgi:hypothetical protein